MAMVAIEKELIEASGFKVKKYADRQDYLLAITRAVAEITDDDFEGLSPLAARWYDMAAANVNSNEDILEFKDTPAKDPDEEEEAEEDEVEEGTEEETAEAEDEEADPDEDADDEGEEAEAEDSDDDEPEEADESDEEEADEGDEEEADEDEPEPEPAPKVKAKDKAAKKTAAKATKKAPAEEPEAEEEPAPKAKAKTKAKAPPRGPKDPDPALIKKFREQEIAENKRKGKKDRLPKTRYDEMIGVKNRYGYYEGTKTDEALKMFEKGAKMSDVTAYLGDTYYNALRRLKAEGHLVERLDDGKLKLTHSSDMGGKKAKAK